MLYFFLQISLLSQNEVETIQLPPNTKAIRDLTILPDGLALLASLGKKLLLFRFMCFLFGSLLPKCLTNISLTKSIYIIGCVLYSA